MNQNIIYHNLYKNIGFERTDLFEFIRDVFHSKSVLYPGCSMHISPSFIFPQVTYVDKSQDAADFFSDRPAVMKIIEDNRRDKGSGSFDFLFKDYVNEGLPLKDSSFDLLISLYADHVIDNCSRFVRTDGIVICNNFHDEALRLDDKAKLALIGFIRKTNQKYHFFTDHPLSELKHRDEEKLQKRCLKNKNGRLWYEDHETYYVFRKTR